MRIAFLVVVSIVIGTGLLPGIVAGQTPLDDRLIRCVAAIRNPAYPRIAQLANISGSVEAHFSVSASGNVEGLRLEGNPILGWEVRTDIQKTVFPHTCQSHTFDVTVRFQLNDLWNDITTAVTFTPPDEYIVKTYSLNSFWIFTSTRDARDPLVECAPKQ